MPNYKGRRPGTRRIVIWKDGRAHEWVIEGTKADGDRFEAQKRLELAAVTGGRGRARSAPTFSEFCSAEYAPHARRHLRESTWRKVRVYQVATLAEYFGSMRLDRITLADVERFKEVRLDDEVRESSVNNELRVLRTMLNYAAAVGYALPDLKWRRLPERGKRRVTFWTEAQVRRFYAATRELYPELLPLFVFLVNTGARKGEALAAEWSWIDFRAGMVRIPATEHWQPKDGESRDVPMSDAVRAALSGERRHERWLFPNRHGRQYRAFPKDAFWAIRDRAGLRGGVHTTRHTFASHFLARQPDMYLLAQVLGHSHERVTELYSHLLPEHLARARNVVNIAPELEPLAKAGA